MLDCGCWLPGNSQKTVDVQLQHYFETIPNTMFTAFRCFTGECVNDQGLWFCNFDGTWRYLWTLVKLWVSCFVTLCITYAGHSITSILADEFGVIFVLAFVASALAKSLQPWFRSVMGLWVQEWSQLIESGCAAALPHYSTTLAASRISTLSGAWFDLISRVWQQANLTRLYVGDNGNFQCDPCSLRSLAWAAAALKCLWIYEHFEM